MNTLMDDSNIGLPGVRKLGHRHWFVTMATSFGFDPVDKIAPNPKVEARVDHGRWLADCPFCNGAELVTEDDPIFLCLSCGNAEVKGELLDVKFPSLSTRKQAEDLLRARSRHHRNWDPAKEGIEQLKAENEAHRLEN